ncbi:MAG: hypothetical protein AB2L24_13975 [Mangrovibacterium sp.]
MIAFGPRIPFGDRFDREKLWGAKEITAIRTGKKFEGIYVVKSPLNRIRTGTSYSFDPLVSTSWHPLDGNRIANFNDGSASVFSNRYGEGRTYVVTLSAANAVGICPDLLRGILDEAVAEYQVFRPFDVIGMTAFMDVSMNGGGDDCSVSVANYGNNPVDLTIKPLLLNERSKYTLTDLKTGNVLSEKTGKDYLEIPVRIKSNDYLVLSLTETGFPVQTESE